MKIRIKLLLAALCLHSCWAQAQGTAFSYQGRLTDNGAAAAGSNDFTFTLYNAASGGLTVGVSNVANNLVLTNGLFSVALDFGAEGFDGTARWLQIAVRPGASGGAYTNLMPRQPINATPYALRANLASSAAAVAGLQLNTNLSSTALGFNTVATGSASTAMGNSAAASGSAATALGQSTTASGGSSLAAGQESWASGKNSTALGFQTVASGRQATSLGQNTIAGGFNSFAGGTLARADHDGSFVWADYNYVDFVSTATNQFLIRAAGGVGINTNNPNGAALAVHGNVTVHGSVTVNGMITGNGSGLTNLSSTALNPTLTFDGLTSADVPNQLQYPTGGTLPSSVAVGDVNGDGRADLAVANGGSGTVTILVNTGAGFALAATIAARAGASEVILADVNRDGHLDLLCSNADHSIAVARGTGNGSFNAATFHASTPTLTKIAVGDLNGDTWPDLVAGTSGTNVVPIFFNNGAGSFPPSPSSLLTTAPNPTAVALAQLTGNLNLDLVTGHGFALSPETNVAVYPGNGSGGFAAPILVGTGTGLKTLAIADMNRDGLKDIVIGMGQSGGRIDVVTNSGLGSFLLRQTLPTAYIVSLASGDFNDDGWPDVAVRDVGFGNYSGMRMMVSGAAGQLVPGLHLTPFLYPSVMAGDLDGDGQSELIFPNGGSPGSVTVMAPRQRISHGLAVSGATTLLGPVTISDPALFTDGLTASGPSTFSSSVTVAGGLGVGTASPQTALHVYSPNNPTTIRVQSAAQPGAGRIEFLSDPQGSDNEWRPGYVQSTDSGGFTGGLSFVVNGTGFANRFAEVETMRVVNGRVGIGTPTPVSALQVIGTVTATAFNPPSDRNLKENFSSVSPLEVLEKVSALPISRWNFKGDAATPHVGPMAQDFHAAFGLGTDERHIATVDADGVALAAIQGLNQKLEAEVKARDARIGELEKRLSALESLLKK